jgi:hypothetical protein
VDGAGGAGGDRLNTPMKNYLLAVAIGLDVLVNGLIGGRKYQTMSCRIGESIQGGGWASHVPWPAWFRAHCLSSVFETIV